METTAEYIKSFLEKTKQAQSGFAYRLGVEPMCVSLWVTGKSKPSVKNALKMADLFGLDLKKLRPDIWGVEK